jgi:hypothetical protein
MSKTIVYYDRVKGFKNMIHKVSVETDDEYICLCGETICKNDIFFNGELTEKQIEDIKNNPKHYHRPVFCTCMN